MHSVQGHTVERAIGLTPLLTMAILSARRAVESRCVIHTTVFVRSPEGDRDIDSMVSNISFCACPSSEDVC